MNIGETIRTFRLNKGMSQGDVERRTGLLPCYLSRVENGHTTPSLDTLARIASALDVPLALFFGYGSEPGQPLNSPETRFLEQIGKHSKALGNTERKLIITMMKKMAKARAA